MNDSNEHVYTWTTFSDWYQGEDGNEAMGAIKYGEHPKDSRMALQAAFIAGRKISNKGATNYDRFN